MRFEKVIPIAQRACGKRISTTNLSICSTRHKLDTKNCSYRPTTHDTCVSSSNGLRKIRHKILNVEHHLAKCSVVKSTNASLLNGKDKWNASEVFDNSITLAENNCSISPISTSFVQYSDKENKSWTGSVKNYQHVNSVFKAFIEASMSIEKYGDVVNMFHHLNNMKGTGTIHISTYYDVLRCVARLGDLKELKIIWGFLQKENIEPDERCYISAFQCLGFSKTYNGFEDISLAKDMENSMTNQGLTFDKLFEAGKYNFRDCDDSMFLEGVRMLKSQFQPKYQLIRHPQYNNSLLEELDLRNTSKLQPALSKHESRDKLKKALHKQIQMESDAYVEIPSLSNKGFDKGQLEQNQREIDQLCNQWRDTLKLEIKRRLDILDMKQEENKHPQQKSFSIQTFLRVLSLDELSEICVHQIRNIVSESLSGDSRYSPSVTILQKMLGEEVMKKYHLNLRIKDKQYMEKYVSALEQYLDWIAMPSNSSAWCHREAYDSIISQMSDGPRLNFVPQEWPFSVILSVGRELLHTIISKVEFRMDSKSNILFDSSEKKNKSNILVSPVLFRILLRMRKLSQFMEELKPHPIVAKLFSKQKFHTLKFPVDQLPTLVPPLPWKSPHQGGYFLHPSTLIRVSEMQVSPQYKDMLDSKTQKVYPIFDSLNVLGSTPWIVNKAILNVITHAFRDQDKYRPYLKKMGIPSDPDLVVIPKLNHKLKEKVRLKKLSPNERKEYQDYMNEKQIATQHRVDCNSLWNDTQYRLSIANSFKDDICFFPHNIDFRGRVYPIPPHFNHMGGDLVRSMFIFAEGKPLGPEGLTWLKLHAINLTGTMKKQSVSARLEHAEKNLHLILDSADSPFGGKRWWLESEDPLQTLAACFEIRNALEFARNSSKSHEDYVCHLPIHQDGSCNGLQHYAALGRDVLGAASVNLIPAESPQDVYNEIANIVERRRCDDEGGSDSAKRDLAKIVKGFVRRKVIKQTVMTTVYGVTKYGAKLQIARQLEDLDDFPQGETEPASKYLAQLTFESLNEMFHASQEIQAWFTDCSNSICGTLSKPVEWETPLGLPVIQPYVKRLTTPQSLDRGKQKEMQTAPLDARKLMAEREIKEKPNLMKQRNGFPPNFIHSLDSSHMMLTSLYLWNLGITYASVHDCYWTHASSVKPMNEVCREQFVRLHSLPILESLAQSFETNYLISNNECDMDSDVSNQKVILDIDLAKTEKLFNSFPSKGNDECCLNLNIVKKSVYFFS